MFYQDLKTLIEDNTTLKADMKFSKQYCKKKTSFAIFQRRVMKA